MDTVPTPLATAGPVDAYLNALHARVGLNNDGAAATYIPELAKVDPELFGIAIATVDGKVYTTGDADTPFTIQSISKAFVYGYALAQFGREAVLKHVGVEPTGEAFNSIVLDDTNNRPYNPMVNAGAMAAAELIQGETPETRIATMLEVMSRYAGRSLHVDEAVFRSEQATGHRNRAIAYMMLNAGMIRSAPETILDIYFRQCSVRVTCTDLAVMAATLANNGVNPLTGERALPTEYIHDVLTVMNSCGMYNYAGQWSYEVGMPAKSGVAGGIIAVIPGQIGIGVFSPRLDQHGHSVRGVQVCKELSETFGLHIFRNHINSGTVIRRDLSGDVVRSKRMRTPEERTFLDKEGKRIRLIELQGALFFGSTERVLRHIDEMTADADYIILDFRRVHEADQAAWRLIMELTDWIERSGKRPVFAHVTADGPLAPVRALLAARAGNLDEMAFDHRDQALEWCENQLIATRTAGRDTTKFALSSLNLFAGLTRDEIRILEGAARPLVFEKGRTIVREGDQANLFFAVARGTVSVQLRVPVGDSEKIVRIASLGPGLSFGEMALLDGGKRSADVVADDRVICYGFSVEHLKELGLAHPRLITTILGNMMRDFSERLRRANDEIRALEQ